MDSSRQLPTFTESVAFSKQVDETGSLDLLFAIQDELLLDATRGDIVPGTNGIRKARIGDPAKKLGKRGGYRYLYLYIEHRGRIFLLYLYAKRAAADVSPAQKKVLAELVESIKKELGKSPR
ncbi:MAG TPA: type II toxin-antitoxin system RelE/ParE family toxin [Blastocatellia bacterium]|nr:type II toxin-antitoxin system RelE/ParE family toxin [Blastocatellia bacterium]